MAKARSSSPQPIGPRRSMLLRTITTFLIVLIVMVGLTILIIWLAIKPKKPFYYIKDASIHNYNSTKDHHLYASYHLVLRSFNPNNKMSLQYKKMEVKIMFENETIARGVIKPRHQHKGNGTNITLHLTSSNVELSGPVSEHMEFAKQSDQIVLGMELKSRIRSKLGIWISRYYHMKVSCVHVVAYFSNSSHRSYGGCRTFL